MATAYNTSNIILPQGAGYKASTLYAWNPQQKQTVDFDVVRATTATRVNQNGLIESVAANVPRIDYLNGGCGELLVEPQRTNLFTYSEQFDNAAWSKESVTINADAITSPDGTANADEMVEVAATARHRVSQSDSFTTGNSYTLSVFVKKNSSNRFLCLNANTAFNARSYLNLDTLEVTTDFGSASVTDYGNSWYKFSVTGTATATATTVTYIQLQDAATDVTYLGDGSSVYIWGAQLEQGSYATSYIPTVASTVTRNADVISLTGASALLGDSEGGLFVEASWFDAQALGVIGLNGGSAADRVIFGAFTGKIRHILSVSSSTPVAGNGSLTITANTFYKIATRYAVNDYAAYIDGASDFTDTTLNTFSDATLTDVDLSNGVGNDPFYGRIRQLVVFDQALLDEELSSIAAYASFTEIANANNYTING